MKGLLLFGCSLFAGLLFAQTTIYSENFETGNSFTLDATDLGAAYVNNTWLVNNSYAGGSGTLICLGFPFTFTVNNTPSQPGGITGSPSSNYLHISAQSAISSGITCASYLPADGLCAFDETNFAKMTTPISTLGFTGVTIDFWWMCAGSVDGYGEIYYSLDGGTTWTLKQSNFNNVTNWSQTAISDPLWDNVASLQFAYRFVNNTAATAADPAFSIDEIVVTGMGATNSIATTDVQPTAAWCFGDITTLQVSFDALGTYNTGNVFTAELSDATGSFAAPTAIGTLTSSASGIQLITAIVPGTVPAGTGYRIRVVASDPATIGTDNGSDLVIFPLPTVTQSSFVDLCSNGSPVNLVGGSPAGGSYSGTGVSGGMFDPSAAGAGSTNVTYTFVDNNGCANSATESILVNQAPAVTFDAIPNQCINDPDYTLVATPSGGTFTGPATTGSVFSPSTAGVGTWTITYDYTDGNGCSGQGVQTVVVDPCGVGIDENETIAYSIYPNPAEGFFSVVSELEFDSIELKDLNGRLVQEIASNELVNVSSLSAGIYIVELMYAGQQYSERIMLK
ncbi:MAG: T9SS type A sorting domain-containing protein [Crocinitomicaceae bacterium]|nr:T9SS type A sorting domain-containing protein [Crocinitomicaceae bacterium]